MSPDYTMYDFYKHNNINDRTAWKLRGDTRSYYKKQYNVDFINNGKSTIDYVLSQLVCDEIEFGRTIRPRCLYIFNIISKDDLKIKLLPLKKSLTEDEFTLFNDIISKYVNHIGFLLVCNCNRFGYFYDEKHLRQFESTGIDMFSWYLEFADSYLKLMSSITYLSGDVKKFETRLT